MSQNTNEMEGAPAVSMDDRCADLRTAQLGARREACARSLCARVREGG